MINCNKEVFIVQWQKGQHYGYLSSRVMDSLWHMDIDGFMRWLAGTKKMGKRRYISVYLQLELVESM